MKSVENKQIKIKGRYYYATMILLPTICIVIKNIIFQAFILGNSMYEINISIAIKETYRYWIFYLAITMLILSVTMLIKNDKIKIVYIFAVDIAITILLYMDLLYNRSFYTMPSAVTLAMVTNLTGGGTDAGEITSLFSGYDVLLLFDFAALLIFVIVFRKRQSNLDTERKYLNYSFGIVLLMSVVILLVIPVKAVITKDSSEYNKIYGTNDADSIAKHFGAVGFHVNDIYEIIKDKYFPEMTKEDKKSIEKFYSWRNAETIADDDRFGMFKDKNIIFFQVESLESFVINQKINGKEITPNINKVLADSYYYSSIYEEVQCGNSSDADLMYMTSILPATKGCTFYRYDNVELDSFPKRLKNQGYFTEYFQAIDGKFWNYESALTNMIGIEKFYGLESYDAEEKIGFTVSDKSFLEQTYTYVRRSVDKKKKVYAHIVCNSSHMPFDINPELSDLNLDDKISDSYFGGYINAINYVDKCIGEFIGRLEKDGRLDDTVIIIAGDHTGLHKYYEYTLKKYYDEYPWLNVNGNYTVPFIIYNTSIRAGFESEQAGGQIDIMPTLAYLFGEHFTEEGIAMGKNLLLTDRNMALFRSGEVYGKNISEDDKNILGNAYNVSDIIFTTLGNENKK